MNTRIQDALQVLYEEGLKHKKPEYQEGANRAECIGLAIAEGMRNSRDIAHLTYSAWEDMNSHAACSVLNWMFDLYPDSYYDGDLKALQWLIDGTQDIKTDWNWEKMGYDTARFKVTVKIEKLDPVVKAE